MGDVMRLFRDNLVRDGELISGQAQDMYRCFGIYMGKENAPYHLADSKEQSEIMIRANCYTTVYLL